MFQIDNHPEKPEQEGPDPLRRRTAAPSAQPPQGREGIPRILVRRKLNPHLRGDLLDLAVSSLICFEVRLKRRLHVAGAEGINLFDLSENFVTLKNYSVINRLQPLKNQAEIRI